jgi:hypothetical protein
MQAITTIGLDIAKSVFQVHGVDACGQVVLRRQLKRRYVLAFFQKLPPCVVGIEACASSHHWSRELQTLGHTIRLMSPAYVKPYVKRRKNDAPICMLKKFLPTPRRPHMGANGRQDASPRCRVMTDRFFWKRSRMGGSRLRTADPETFAMFHGRWSGGPGGGDDRTDTRACRTSGGAGARATTAAARRLLLELPASLERCCGTLAFLVGTGWVQISRPRNHPLRVDARSL